MATFRGFPKEAYRALPRKKEGWDAVRYVRRRDLNAKKLREEQFIEVAPNEFLDKALVSFKLVDIAERLNSNNGEARELIGVLESEGLCAYEGDSTWALTLNGIEKLLKYQNRVIIGPLFSYRRHNRREKWEIGIQKVKNSMAACYAVLTLSE